MMLSNIEWEMNILFEDSMITTLFIENKKYFRKLLLDLKRQIDGDDGPFTLSREGTELNISKSSLLINDILYLDPNNKVIQSKLINKLVDIANCNVDELYIVKKMLEKYYDNLIFSEHLSLTRVEGIDTKGLLKLGGFRFDIEDDDIIEELITYIEIVKEFLDLDLIILVNLHSIIDKDEKELFYNQIVSKKINVLCIESEIFEDYDIRRDKNRVYIIDQDMCELYN